MEEKFVVNVAKKYRKEETKVEIVTTNYRITGTAFKNLNERFSDHLNNISEDFIALKAPIVRSAETDKVLMEKDYISVNKNHVIFTSELA